MAKVFVFTQELTSEEVDELILLLRAAGVAEEDVVLVGEVAPAGDDCQDDIFVFLLAPAAIGALEASIGGVPDGGRRAICVWPSDAPDIPQPPEVAKYSNSTVPWDPEKVRAAMADDDVTICQMSSGKTITPPETDRNECDD